MNLLGSQEKKLHCAYPGTNSSLSGDGLLEDYSDNLGAITE